MNDQELKDAIANLYKTQHNSVVSDFSVQFKNVKDKIKEINSKIDNEQDVKKKLDLFGYLYKNL
jgi:predicted transcriptional regulator